MSHPTWVRGLKRAAQATLRLWLLSHPTWVRGLKLCFPCAADCLIPSHPTWVRGLKLSIGPCFIAKIGRTLRGCVD